jgi:hypothetical protein
MEFETCGTPARISWSRLGSVSLWEITMKKYLTCSMLTALALAAGQASAADLYLINIVPLGGQGGTANICDVASQYFIGNNPSTLCLKDDNVFVAGYNFSGTSANLRIVKIETIFGTRGYRLVPVSAPLDPPAYDTLVPSGRQFVGMDYQSGRGLIVNYDSGALGTQGAVRTYDIDTQLTPILLVSSPAGLGPRGFGGSAWDVGFRGGGFGALSAVVSILDVGGYPGNAVFYGPIGINPATLEAVPTIYDGSPTGTGGGPDLAAMDLDGDQIPASHFWRDLDISQDGNLIAARTNNKLVLYIRTEANNAGSLNVLSDAVNPPVQVNGQNVQIADNFPGGTLVFYNDRRSTATTQAWTDVIKAVRTDGSAVSLNFWMPDGVTPAGSLDLTGSQLSSFLSGAGYYDFSWDGANERLAISDFTNRQIYVFSTTPPPPACVADVDDGSGSGTPDGGVTIDDLLYFLLRFEAGC